MNLFKTIGLVGCALTGAMFMFASDKLPFTREADLSDMAVAPGHSSPKKAERVFEPTAPLKQSTQNVIQQLLGEQADGKRIVSTMLYRGAWDAIDDFEQVPYGIYTFDPGEEITFTQRVKSSDMAYVSAGTIVDGMYFVCVPMRDDNGYVSGSLYAAFDVNSYQLLATDQGALGTVAYQLATDPTTGSVYGVFYNDQGTGWCWGKLDLPTMQRTYYGDCGFMLAFGCDVDGKCYGVNADNDLVSFDAATGDVNVIGPTDVNAEYMLQSGTIDPETGVFYWAAYNSESGSALYSIDKNTGHACKIGDFTDSEELVALAIAAEMVDKNAPARPAKVEISFAEGSFSGTASASTPTITYSREPLTGDVEAVFLVDQQEVKRMAATPGQTVSAEISVPNSGFHTVGVYFSNAAGKGPQNSVQYYFGIDAPGKVIEPTLVNNDGVAELTWDAPEDSYHGGYFEPSRFNYTVIRHRAGVDTTVAEHLTDTEWSEAITAENIETIYYTVVAYSDDVEGASVNTNKATFGDAFNAPCEWQLDDPDEFALFTVIDANGDGFSWEPGTWRYTQNHTTYAQCMWNDDELTDADDWFISPAVRLNPGRLYYFTFSMANTMETMTEIMEVKMGQGTTLADMATTIHEPYELKPIDNIFVWEHNRSAVQVSEAGNYNFGIHCISKAPHYYRLYIDSLYVEAGPVLDGPKAVQDLQIVPAAKGALGAQIRFTAPSQTLNGQAVDAITKVEVYRRPLAVEEWTLVNTVENLQPGQIVTIDDAGMQNGWNVYRFVPYNAAGDGETSEQRAYIGLDKPMPLKWVDYEFADEGFKLYWPKPDSIGTNGGYVNPDGVWYSIFDGHTFEYIERAYTDTVILITEPSLWEARLTMAFWLVSADNEIGHGESAVCERYIHGAPRTLPYVETFDNGQLSSDWFTGDNNMFGGTWRIGSDPSGDGAISYTAAAGGFRGIVMSPMDLTGTEHPVLKFDHYKTANTLDSMQVYVSVHGLKESLHRIYCAVDGKDRVTHTVDLTPYRDSRRVTIAFGGWGVNAACTQYLDNITVRESYGHNLAMGAVKAASEVAYDGKLKVTATVTNYGDFKAEGYTVNLYKDGRTLVASVPGTSLEAGKSADFTLYYEASLSDDDHVSLHVEIDYEEDELPDDDASEIFQVLVRKPAIPVVDDLQGQQADADLQLTWSEPKGLHGFEAEVVTDSFEGYQDFEVEAFGDWTLYDADGLKVYGIGSLTYPNQYGPCAFQVFNATALGIGSGTNVSAHTGDKYLIAFASQLGGVEDWLFSPALSGEEQTITFWAKGMNDNLVENFEFWTGNVVPNPMLMAPAGTYKTQSGWHEYSVTVPAGTKYFAIRYKTANGNALMIDDVTYTCAAQPCVFTFTGYNIYRDDTRLNELPQLDCSYRVANAADGQYTVTVVYEELESPRSNAVVLGQSGLGVISADQKPSSFWNLLGQPVDRSKLRSGVFYVGQGETFMVR